MRKKDKSKDFLPQSPCSLDTRSLVFQEIYIDETELCGGWQELKSLRKKGLHLKSAERILSESDIVESVLQQQDEAWERRYGWRASGYDLDKIIERVGDLFDMPQADILQPGKQPKRVHARSLVCNWALSELGLNGTAVGQRLGLTQSAVSRAVQRCRKIAADSKYLLKL